MAAEDGQTIEPDNAYVIPPGREAVVFQGNIQLLSMLEKGIARSIDSFFRSLALDRGDFAAAAEV